MMQFIDLAPIHEAMQSAEFLHAVSAEGVMQAALIVWLASGVIFLTWD